MEQNELFHKLKADELRGEARERFDAYTLAIAKSTMKLTIVSILAMFVWLVPISIFAGSLEAWADSDSEIGLLESFRNTPVLLYVLIAFGAAAIVLSVWWVFAFKKHKRFNAYTMENDLPEITRLMTKQFELPEDSQTASFDILQNVYGKNAVKPRAVKKVVSVAAYRKGSSIYFLASPYLLKIPIDDCTNVEMVEQKLVFTDLMPSFDLKDPEIRQYGIIRYNSNNNSYSYRTKHYGKLSFLSGGEIWELCILPHQLETIKKLFHKN